MRRKASRRKRYNERPTRQWLEQTISHSNQLINAWPQFSYLGDNNYQKGRKRREKKRGAQISQWLAVAVALVSYSFIDAKLPSIRDLRYTPQKMITNKLYLRKILPDFIWSLHCRESTVYNTYWMHILKINTFQLLVAQQAHHKEMDVGRLRPAIPALAWQQQLGLPKWVPLERPPTLSTDLRPWDLRSKNTIKVWSWCIDIRSS